MIICFGVSQEHAPTTEEMNSIKDIISSFGADCTVTWGIDYISLTDMARSQLQEHIIFRWLSLKSTIEYLGEWEMLYNSNFNCTEFGTFRNMAGSNNFVLSVKT